MQRLLLTIAALSVISGPVWSQATRAEMDQRRQHDEKALLEKNIQTDGRTLLRFFRERTLSKAQIDQLAAKVAQLGTATYRERKQAFEELLKAGETAKPVLCDAAKTSQADLEINRRIELCLRALNDGQDARLVAAAARLLAHRKPAGAAEVILNYLPFSTDPTVMEELQEALVAVAVRDGKPEPVVVSALTDPKPIKRSFGAEALVRAGVQAHLPKVRELLKDAECEVRARVAPVLAEARDKTAVPVLIDLVAELPGDKVWEIEDLLNRLAGDAGPNLYRDGKTPPAKVRDAWKAWWAKNADKVDLAKLSEIPPLQGLTLITQMDKGLNGRIYEVGQDKEIRWQFAGIRYPVFAQISGRDRVLVCEYLNRKVTERDFKGNVVWERQADMPVACQRFPNGDTFIVSRRQLILVDREGKELFTYAPAVPSIAAAHRARDGQMVLVGTGGQCERLDANGKLVKSFTVGPVYTLGGNIDLLPNGRVLIPQFRDNRIVEYDADGKEVWHLKVNAPTSVSRLSNGHYLVVSMAEQRVVELTRDGGLVWEYRTDGRPWSARKR